MISQLGFVPSVLPKRTWTKDSKARGQFPENPVFERLKQGEEPLSIEDTGAKIVDTALSRTGARFDSKTSKGGRTAGRFAN